MNFFPPTAVRFRNVSIRVGLGSLGLKLRSILLFPTYDKIRIELDNVVGLAESPSDAPPSVGTRGFLGEGTPEDSARLWAEDHISLTENRSPAGTVASPGLAEGFQEYDPFMAYFDDHPSQRGAGERTGASASHQLGPGEQPQKVMVLSELHVEDRRRVLDFLAGHRVQFAPTASTGGSTGKKTFVATLAVHQPKLIEDAISGAVTQVNELKKVRIETDYNPAHAYPLLAERNLMARTESAHIGTGTGCDQESSQLS